MFFFEKQASKRSGLNLQACFLLIFVRLDTQVTNIKPTTTRQRMLNLSKLCNNLKQQIALKSKLKDPIFPGVAIFWRKPVRHKLNAHQAPKIYFHFYVAN